MNRQHSVYKVKKGSTRVANKVSQSRNQETTQEAEDQHRATVGCVVPLMGQSWGKLQIVPSQVGQVSLPQLLCISCILENWPVVIIISLAPILSGSTSLVGPLGLSVEVEADTVVCINFNSVFMLSCSHHQDPSPEFHAS